METPILTVLLVFLFFYLYISKNNKINKIVYRQSDIHKVIRGFALQKKQVSISQTTKHSNKNNIKVIILDSIAYWVKDNIFYTAETNNGNVVVETAKPINVEDMSRKELDKMLLILDNLSRGNRNDSSSSRD
jgi:hypothetical protein